MLLGHAANMPSVNAIHFFYERPYDALLKSRASIPNLKRLLFNDIGDQDLEAFRRALPRVQVDIYEESRDKDPAFEVSDDARNAEGATESETKLNK